jgi:hypothetical protein
MTGWRAMALAAAPAGCACGRVTTLATDRQVRRALRLTAGRG